MSGILRATPSSVLSCVSVRARRRASPGTVPRPACRLARRTRRTAVPWLFDRRVQIPGGLSRSAEQRPARRAAAVEAPPTAPDASVPSACARSRRRTARRDGCARRIAARRPSPSATDQRDSSARVPCAELRVQRAGSRSSRTTRSRMRPSSARDVGLVGLLARGRQRRLGARVAALGVEQPHVDLGVAVARVVPRDREAVVAAHREADFVRAEAAVADLPRRRSRSATRRGQPCHAHGASCAAPGDSS